MTLEQLNIGDVWQALGGGELRHGRARSLKRNGEGYSVSINLEKNVWMDFVDNSGGGILALVTSVLNCTKAAALAWLEANCSLDTRRPLSLEERRRYARAAAESEVLAVRLADFAHGLELIADQTVRALDASGADPEVTAPYHRRLFIVRSAKPSDIAGLWREMPAAREAVERVGREHRERSEAVTRSIVELLAATSSSVEAAA